MKQTIGAYTTEKLLGRGSYGEVYLAKGPEGDKVALKCIEKKQRTINEIKNLRGETAVLEKINHPNIIKLLNHFETDTAVVVAMEYAGHDLSRLMQRERKLVEGRVRAIGRQIVAAMDYLSQLKIVHRDLKPQNILIEGDQIKLCDFGFAKKMSASVNFLNSIKGTPLYCAPQIVLHQHYTPKVDVWSLGVILYELATGNTPFYATKVNLLNPKILHETPKYPSYMSPQLRNLIDNMLQKTATKRFTWQQVKNHQFFQVADPEKWKPQINNEQIEEQKVVKWEAEEEIQYLTDLLKKVEEKTIKIEELKYDEEFCLRVTRTIGEYCLNKKVVPDQIILDVLKLIKEISRIKDVLPDNEGEDIIKDRNLMTAVVGLASSEETESALTLQMQVIAYLLKKNFDKVCVDRDYDDEITNRIIKKLKEPTGRPCLSVCINVLGTLAAQALISLENSFFFFERAVEERWMQVIANLYSRQPEDFLVLDCMSRFIHPILARNCPLNYKIKTAFKEMTVQAAPVLLKKGLIGEELPSFLKGNALHVYLGVLLECLSVSEEIRAEFTKHTYWVNLLKSKTSQTFYLAFCYIILRKDSVNILATSTVQSIVQSTENNKLDKVFLGHLALHNLKSHTSNSASKVTRIVGLVERLGGFLQTDHQQKIQSCQELLGYLAEDAQYFDGLLVETLEQTMEMVVSMPQNMKKLCKVIISQALLLTLSENTLLKLLDLINACPQAFDQAHAQHLYTYTVNSIRNRTFEEYMDIDPTSCGRLLAKCLYNANTLLNDDKEILKFAELVEKSQLVKLVLSQQLASFDLHLAGLNLFNRCISRLKNGLDYASNSLPVLVKSVKQSTEEALKVQFMMFCSSLARQRPDYCQEILKSGIIALCKEYLSNGSEILLDKTLHLVGNLAKHNNMAFGEFEKYNILSLVHDVIERHSQNRRILKNTVYAVGNIAFYEESFSADISPIIKHLKEGVRAEGDIHLVTNTLSTISNLLRHSGVHVQEIIDSGLLKAIMDVYAKTTSPEVINFISNVLRKAVKHSRVLSVYSRDCIWGILQKHITMKHCDIGHDSVRALKALVYA